MIIKKDIQGTISLLTANMRAGLQGSQTVEPLLAALEQGHFFFEPEPWHDISFSDMNRKATTPAEYLLRINHQDAETFNLAKPVSEIYQGGFYALFDTAVVLAAVDQAISNQGFPVSINISSRNASDLDALTGLHEMLLTHFQDRFSPDQIIFEFLEDGQGDQPSAEGLNFMRAHGYKFALDDMTDSPFDQVRLMNLGPYADFVKIDGHFLTNAMLGDNNRLENILTKTSHVAPKAEIICEWVSSAESADLLRKTFPQVGLVQGRYLGHDREAFLKQLEESGKSAINRNGPPLPYNFRPL